MYKVMEKRFFIILLVACYMLIFSGISKAGGGSKMSSNMGSSIYTTSGMGGNSMGGHSNTYSTLYATDWNRTNAILGYPNYSTNLYGQYGYNTLGSPYLNNYSLPYNNSYLNSWGGLNTYAQPYYGYNNYNPANLFGTQVTGKNYTTEQSVTTYVPGGELTTTVAEETETITLPSLYTNYPGWGGTYGNTYNYNPYYGYGNAVGGWGFGW